LRSAKDANPSRCIQCDTAKKNRCQFKIPVKKGKGKLTVSPPPPGPSTPNPLKRKQDDRSPESSAPAHPRPASLRPSEVASSSLNLVYENMLLREQLAASKEDLGLTTEQLRLSEERVHKF
jgi:hypothetical protein